MLLTASPRTTLPQHSAGWRAIRIVTDRAGKNYKTGPADWVKVKHRRLDPGEVIAAVEQRIRVIRSVAALRESRP